MRRTYRLIALVLAAGTCSACGATLGARPGDPEAAAPEDPSVLAADLAKTRPLGPGPAYRPSAVANPNAQLGLPVGSLRCRSLSAAYGVHIELFARDRGVQVPAGIGIVQGRRRGPFVDRGRCRYELSTTDPTGVIAVRTRASLAVPTVGQLFALWGQPLSRERLGSFAGT